MWSKPSAPLPLILFKRYLSSVFRLSIFSFLILMLIAACFFAIIGNAIRSNQLGHAANLALKTKLEELIDGARFYISTVEDTGLSCDVSSTSISDDDLQKLIQLSSERTPGTSQIFLLNLEKTSVTDAGLRSMAESRYDHVWMGTLRLRKRLGC